MFAGDPETTALAFCASLIHLPTAAGLDLEVVNVKLSNVLRAFTWVICVLLVEAALCADAAAMRPGSPASAAAAPAVAEPPASTHPQSARIRQLLNKLGSGEDTLIATRLRDGAIVSGYLVDSGPSSFSITDRRSGTLRNIDYNEVDRLAGYNLVTGTQVEQGGGIRAKLARLASYILPVKRISRNNLSGGSKVLLIGILIGILVAVIVAKTI